MSLFLLSFAVRRVFFLIGKAFFLMGELGHSYPMSSIPWYYLSLSKIFVEVANDIENCEGL